MVDLGHGNPRLAVADRGRSTARPGGAAPGGENGGRRAAGPAFASRPGRNAVGVRRTDEGAIGRLQVFLQVSVYSAVDRPRRCVETGRMGDDGVSRVLL